MAHERPRIGVILPSSNTVVEEDFRVLADVASVHFARMHLAEVTAAAER